MKEHDVHRGRGATCSLCQRVYGPKEEMTVVTDPDGAQATLCTSCMDSVHAIQKTHGGTEWEALALLMTRIQRALLNRRPRPGNQGRRA